MYAVFLLIITRLYFIRLSQNLGVDDPDSVNAVDGATVQFSCVVQFSSVGTREVDFFVNNTATNAACFGLHCPLLSI